MPSPAVPQNVADRWRPLSAQEETVATTLLGDAWRMLRRQMTALGFDVENAADMDDDVHDEVVRVLSTAVIRVMQNPEGKKSEAVDDYTYTRDSSVASGQLYFTDDEIGALLPGSTSRDRAFVLDPLADYASRWQ